MTDRLPRSNSQSQLPNYGQDQSDTKKDVDKKKDGAPAQSDKNTGQGHSDNNKAAPKMKSKEEKKVKTLNARDPDEEVNVPDTFGRLFLGKGPSAAARKFEGSDESSSEDSAGQSESKTLKSPSQQQSDKKEKTANNKVPKLSLKNLGNALASLASDRRDMAISPRKTRRETNRNTQDTIFSTSNTAATEGTTTTSTTTTTTTANTAVGDAAIPRTNTVVTVPLWQPASPRSEWNTTSQSNPPASAKSKGTNTTATTTTTSQASWIPTSPRSKNSSNTQSPSVKTTTQAEAETKASVVKEGKNTSLATASENTVSKTATVKEKAVGSVYADDLSEQSIKTINLALSGTIVSGADLAELLVCFQSSGYK